MPVTGEKHGKSVFNPEFQRKVARTQGREEDKDKVFFAIESWLLSRGEVNNIPVNANLRFNHQPGGRCTNPLLCSKQDDFGP